MVRKSDMVRNLVKNGQYQKALAIAKKFTMGISTKDHRAMVLAHECYVERKAGIERTLSFVVSK